MIGRGGVSTRQTMSRTVSFRASEELDEFLKQEAERRMTTKSTVAQMLVAERAREIRGGEVEAAEAVESEEETTESEEETTESEEEATESEEAGIGEEDGLPPVFERHSEKWYVPNSDKGYNFAVKMGEESGTERNYYKTAEGAARRLREQYDDEGV